MNKMAKKTAKKKLNTSEMMYGWLHDDPTLTLTQVLRRCKRLETAVAPAQFYKIRREMQEKHAEDNDKNEIPEAFVKETNKNDDEIKVDDKGSSIDLVSVLKARRVISDALCEVRTILDDRDGLACVVIYDVMDEFMDVFEYRD